MIKAKFGDHLRSKPPTAMINEALCQILAHNICCLIQSQYELGVEANFWEEVEQTPKQIAAEPMTEGMEARDWI